MKQGIFFERDGILNVVRVERRHQVSPLTLEEFQVNEAIAPFEEPLLLRSEVRQGRKPQGERVFILDTVGELVAFYALATVAVVGGSFYPGVNGHNPLEPAALQTPTNRPSSENRPPPLRPSTGCPATCRLGGPRNLSTVVTRMS